MSGIVIDGTDLAGKSSIAVELARTAGTIEVVESPQPGFRELIGAFESADSSPFARLALYLGANIALGRRFQRPDRVVVAVRHLPSTIAYHAVANDESATDCLTRLDYLVRQCRRPEATILVEATPAERRRRASAAASDLSPSDRWSLREDVHVRLVGAFREVAERLGTPVLVLDTTGQDAASAARVAAAWLRPLGLI